MERMLAKVDGLRIERAAIVLCSRIAQPLTVLIAPSACD
jgi:hypothetical protein